MTQIALLPQLGIVNADGSLSPAQFFVSTNGGWSDVIEFNQPPPNQTLPLDLTGIAFWAQVRYATGDNTVLLDMSTYNGLFVNGGTNGFLRFNVPVFSTTTSCTSKLALVTAPLIMDLLAHADGETPNLMTKAGPAIVNLRQGVTKPSAWP